MNPEQFVFWLQGYVELTGGAQPSPETWKSICDHLKLVFNKVTPPLNTPIFPPGVRGPVMMSDNNLGILGTPRLTC